MQIAGKAAAREIIRSSRINKPWQLPTVRGGIFDRNEKELAVDRPQFFVQMNYQLTKYLDQKYRAAIILNNTSDEKSLDESKIEMSEKHKKDRDKIEEMITRCSTLLDTDRETIVSNINKINDEIWRWRETIAWKKAFPQSELYLKYKEMGREAPYSKPELDNDVVRDFQRLLEEKDLMSPADEREFRAKKSRYKRALEVNIKEAHELHPICEIPDRNQLLDVQLKFTGIADVQIAPITERVYKYGSAACQIIGWVGPAQANENKLFPNDVYSRYNPEEFSGKKGIEQSCEVILRGKRGEVVYNHDEELLSRKPRQFGEDIYLSIDIELQLAIERYLSDKSKFPDPDAEMGSVVIDVESGEILAMVSVPTYDLRTIRRSVNFDRVNTAKTKPFKSKALYETYPPGSIIKPIFLAMGLETGLVTANEIISCDGSKAPQGWPNCIIRRYGGAHDWKWNNNGRNAIRGSCNIYFSHLADRFSPMVIQGWFYSFGFGHRILPTPNYPGLLKELNRPEVDVTDRRLTEGDGNITSSPEVHVKRILDLAPLKGYEKRQFGIGQGSMRATVLQVTNAMAALARGGVYKAPRLYIGDSESKTYQPKPLMISNATMKVVRDGMHAVVYEQGGTSNDAYNNGDYKNKFPKKKITVFGKTGSTEKPYNAWFAGFAEDPTGRALAFAIIVKRGQSGSKDAAPKGLRILEMCSEMGYIGVDDEQLTASNKLPAWLAPSP